MKAEIQQTLVHLESANAHLREKFDKLKEQLEESHRTLEMLIAHMSDGLMFVSLKGVITLFNPAAEALTGYKQEKLIGTPYWEVFPDVLFGFSLRRALSKPTSEHRILLTLNETKEVEVSTSSVPGKGLLLLLRDRTEMQRLEKSIRHNERLKELGEMAATLAHEIRNPLGGIEGFAQLLKRDLEENSHQQMIEAILEGTRVLNRLVTNVLDYGKPLELRFTPLDLVSLIQETLAYVRVERESCTCTLQSEFSNYLISADRDQLKLTLLNLLRNAFEASSTHVEISIKEGVISISDNGIGIEPKELEKVFTPFFTTKSSGTGLGLAEVYRVVQAHGWEITLDSIKGKGTQCQLKIS